MNDIRKEFDLIDKELFAIVQSQLRNVKKARRSSKRKLLIPINCLNLKKFQKRN